MSAHTKWYGSKAKAAGYRPATWTPQQLADSLGDEFTVFVSSGHVNGTEMFARQTGRIEDGVWVVRTTDGNVVSRVPLDRKLRILVK